jgi:hypothetical protein
VDGHTSRTPDSTLAPAAREVDASAMTPLPLSPKVSAAAAAHDRQRSLVLASLVARPGADRSTHRRWA